MKRRNLVFIMGVSILCSFGTQAKMSKPEIESVPGEFLVKFKKGAELNLLGGQIKRGFEGDSDLFLVRHSQKNKAQAYINLLKHNPNIEFVEPNYIYHTNAMPNDPKYTQTWGMRNGGIDVNAEKAWDVTTGSSAVRVAVIDTGIDVTHSDLAKNIWVNTKEAAGSPGVDDDGNGYVDDINGYNFSENGKPANDPSDGQGHGTHVAGTIGAVGNNSEGVAGVNWTVNLVAVKFLGDDGSGTLDGAVEAIDYATKAGVQVMNASWGGGGYSQAMYDALQRANSKGILFVAAAGNSQNNNDTKPYYPCSYDLPNVMSVAAIDKQGKLASFSSYGAKTVHLAAPGVSILSSYPGNTYYSMSGTSMATPHVTGVAALVLSRRSIGPAELKQILMNTAKPINAVKGKTVSGGIVDAYSALMK